MYARDPFADLQSDFGAPVAAPELKSSWLEQSANTRPKKVYTSAPQVSVQAGPEFAEKFPAQWNWLMANRANNEFADSLHSFVLRNGYLTEKQLAAVSRNLDNAKAAASAPVVNSERLEAAFRTAQSNGLKWPKIILSGIKISPAGANSKNAGALYVKKGDQYLGKVMGGKFFSVGQCTPAQAKVVVDLINDPMGYAEAYGQRTGVCCCCGRLLTNEGSIDRGIGPICAEKFGW